jgi:MFS family permease
VLIPDIQAAFQLSGVGVGAILTVREMVSGLVALPGGIVVDMLRRHWGILLTACIVGFSVGAVMMGLSPVYALLIVGMGVIAASHSIWHLLAGASLSHHFPDRRATALSFHGVGGSVGDVAGPLATGALLAVLSWRGLLNIYAAVPLFLAFLMLFGLKNVGRVDSGEVDDVNFKVRMAATRELLKMPTLWGITLVKGLRGMSLVALLTVIPLYLGNELDLGHFTRGYHVGLLIAAGLVAKPVAGYLSDRLGRKTILVPGLIWSCAMCILLIVFSDGVALTVLIALLGLFLYPDQPILTAAALDIVDSNVASTMLGMTSFAAFGLSALSPLVAGALYESGGVTATLYYVAALFALAAIITLILPLSRGGRTANTSRMPRTA